MTCPGVNDQAWWSFQSEFVNASPMLTRGQGTWLNHQSNVIALDTDGWAAGNRAVNCRVGGVKNGPGFVAIVMLGEKATEHLARESALGGNLYRDRYIFRKSYFLVPHIHKQGVGVVLFPAFSELSSL